MNNNNSNNMKTQNNNNNNPNFTFQSKIFTISIFMNYYIAFNYAYTKYSLLLLCQKIFNFINIIIY